MKFVRRKIALLLFCIIAAFGACEQSFMDDFDIDSVELVNEELLSSLDSKNVLEWKGEYASLNEVPEWVRERVTVEEYDMWKIVSSRYFVDYAFLRDSLSVSQKERIKENLKNLVNDINLGNVQSGENYLMFCDLSKSESNIENRIESLSNSETDGDVEQRALGPGVIFSWQRDIAEVLVTVACTVDNKKRLILSTGGVEAHAGGHCGKDVAGTFVIARKSKTYVEIEGSGTLWFDDPNSYPYEVIRSVNFSQKRVSLYAF